MMNQNLRRVEARLRSGRLPKPPPDLAQRLKSEIPDRPEIGLREPVGRLLGPESDSRRASR